MMEREHLNSPDFCNVEHFVNMWFCGFVLSSLPSGASSVGKAGGTGRRLALQQRGGWTVLLHSGDVVLAECESGNIGLFCFCLSMVEGEWTCII